MVAQAQFSTAGAMVQPGESETLTLMVFNIGNHTETFTLVPAGLVAGWARIVPPTVTLFGGTNQVIEVTVRPPRLPSTPAGPVPLTIRVIPQDEPDDVVIAETTVIIGAFHARHVRLLQPVVRSRRRATYEFLVENEGNTQASCRLHLIDTSRRLDGDFDPPAVGIEPGGTSLVRLRMKSLRRQWRGGTRTLPFSIEADQQGFPTAVANATFVQTPVLPERLGRRIAGLILLAAALAGAWFGLIKPATRREAKDAVRDYSPPVIIATTLPVVPGVTVPGPADPGVTVPDDPTPVTQTVPATTLPDEGELFSQRFAVSADPGATNQQSIQVPDGKQLRITDLIVQNVNADTGIATVLRNDEVIAQWDLGRGALNNDPLQFFSSIVFDAGSTVTFQLACDAPGVSGQCVEGLLLSGKLVSS